MSEVSENTTTIVWPSLDVIDGPDKGSKIRIPAVGLVIGREADTQQLITDSSMSRRHARVHIAPDGSVVVEDLQSANGTFLNGQRVNDPTRVRDGDILYLGNTQLRVSIPESQAGMAEDVLTVGRRLLEDRRLVESAEAFGRALLDPRTAAAGHYGLGMVALALGDPNDAERSFNSALELNRNHSNAAFQLGMIAEGRRDIALAQEWYRWALDADPAHVSARARIDAITPPAQPPMSPMNVHRLGTFTGPAGPGILNFLMEDSAPISRQTVQLMEQLDMEVRPRFLAYVGRYAGAIVAWALLLVIATALVFSSPNGRQAAGSAIGLLGLVTVLGAVAFYGNVKTTRIRISQGRLQIQRGILRRYLDNVDLWRLLNVNLEQTFINRLTGDGTLDLILSLDPVMDPRKARTGATVVRVTGLAAGAQLGELQQGLLNLAFLLRGNPVVKGIIQ